MYDFYIGIRFYTLTMAAEITTSAPETEGKPPTSSCQNIIIGTHICGCAWSTIIGLWGLQASDSILVEFGLARNCYCNNFVPGLHKPTRFAAAVFFGRVTLVTIFRREPGPPSYVEASGWKSKRAEP